MSVPQFLQNKRIIFWLLQVVGWGAWGVTFYLGILVWGDAPQGYIIYLPIISTVGLLISLVLRALYKSIWEVHIVWRALAILAGSAVGGTLWRASRKVIYHQIFPPDPAKDAMHGDNVWMYFEGTASAIMVMMAWSALYFGIKFYMMMQEEQHHRLKATAMAHEAQLKMLRYQLNPHFLFNTLNAISTLILDKETQLANSMVTRLSRFLRYSLDNDPMLKVTVADEIEALKLYLDIEKVRFDNRLQLNFDIDPEASGALMPSLLLQPLVENCIKYAVSQSINGGSISVNASAYDNKLLLSVADDGPGLEIRPGGLPKGTGVGLRNCRERLREIYGDKQIFTLSQTEPHGLTIMISLPLELTEEEL
ncbi:MAG: histidine kinase [Pseudomonadota bacterium]